VIAAAAALALAIPQAPPQAVAHANELSDADSYLDYLLADDVLTSGEFRLAFIALGLERTCEILRPAYASAMADLRPAWRQLFQKALAAGVEDPGPLSPGREISRSQREMLLGLGLVGNELVAGKSEAVKSALIDPALKVPDASINYEEREKEMTAARKNGTADCGLLRELGER
jgi:hypothetical protein